MHKGSVACIVLAGISWGTAGIFTTALYDYGYTAIQLSAGKHIFAALMLLLFTLLFRRDALRTKWTELLLFAISGFSVFTTACLYFASMQASSLSTAVVLMYTAPTFVMIVSVLFLQERFYWTKLLAVLAALVGCGLVTGIIGGLRFSVDGIVLGLLSGITYSIYNICVKVEMRRGNDPLGATTYSFLFGALASLFFLRPISVGQIMAEHFTPSLLLFLGLAFFNSAFPYLIYTYAMKRIPAGVASAMASIEPMTATLISIFCFGERLTVFAAIGILLILGSVVLLSREDETNTKPYTTT